MNPMKRDIYATLSAWKRSKHRKPLVITGARRVGKTFALEEFGKSHYVDTAYFNFETDPALNGLFLDEAEPGQLIEKLSMHGNVPILPRQTLVIFDEIQNAPAALTALASFCEDAAQYHVTAASSLPGLKITPISPSSTGTIDFLHLYPLTFREYLDAIGKPRLRHSIENKKDFDPFPPWCHNQLIRHLKTYCFVGGMPEAVNQYVNDGDLTKVRQVHHVILEAYPRDFSTYSTPAQAARINSIWNAIPFFLSKENKKFKFSHISQNARTRDYRDAVRWLVDEGLAYRCNHIQRPGVPVDRYIDENNFKLYLLDTGLLGTLLNLSPGTIDEGDRLFSDFNHALIENFAAQELIAGPLAGEGNLNGHYYWTNGSTAEVAFILQDGETFYPLDVKVGKSKGKNGLRIYGEKYSPPMLSRTAPMNFGREGDLFNYPLYALSHFPKWAVP